MDFVGIYTGAKMDKLEKCALTRVKSEKVAPPTIAECPIALECCVTEVMPMGSHDVFVADIVSVSCREDIIDKDGKIRFDRADLLAYAHGEYYTLGEVVGKFGFSTDKPKKKATTEKPVEKQISKNAPQKEPFYNSAPKGRGQKKKAPIDTDKGRPHGRRTKGG